MLIFCFLPDFHMRARVPPPTHTLFYTCGGSRPSVTSDLWSSLIVLMGEAQPSNRDFHHWLSVHVRTRTALNNLSDDGCDFSPDS